MDIKKVLICGDHSFVAKGLPELLQNGGIEVTCFSRGKEIKSGCRIFGDVYKITENKYLSSDYDAVINFIFIKNRTIQENETYLKELYRFCTKKNVRYLFHISSISVYKNDEKIISETTEIESNTENKGSYAAIKVATDLYLSKIETDACKVVFLRPGFVVSNEIRFPFAGIAKLLPFNYCLLLGNKKTTLPIIERVELHNKIVSILKLDKIDLVYLLLGNKSCTKFEYVKSISNRKILLLPKYLVVSLAKCLKFLRIINQKQFQQIKGLFKESQYQNSLI